MSSQELLEQADRLPLEPSASQKLWVMLGIGSGVFMFGLDIFIVNITLPTLVRDLHTDFATVQWVPLSYLLILASLVLGAGRLGDLWGKKWLYLSGLLAFTLGSLLCGFAPTVGFLIGFRALQGLGAVFISALGTAIITEIYPKEENGRALGLIGGNFLLGVTLGPTVGGLLISLGSWRLIFWVNVPVGLIAISIVALAIPYSTKSETKQRFDLFGVMLASLTLSCFILALTKIQVEGFASQTGLLLFAGAIVSFGSFLAVEKVIPAPMLALELLSSLEINISLLLSLMVFVVRAGIIFITPFFLELVKQYPPGQAGLLMGVGPISLA